MANKNYYFYRNNHMKKALLFVAAIATLLIIISFLATFNHWNSARSIVPFGIAGRIALPVALISYALLHLRPAKK